MSDRADGFGVLSDRLVILTFLVVGHAPVDVGLSICRIEPDSFGELGDGLVVLTLLKVGHAPVVAVIGIATVRTGQRHRR